MIERFDRLPAASPGHSARILWAIAAGCTLAGLMGWATQTLVGGVIALWLFCIAAAAVALVLPLPWALVSPLFAGVAGWLVDMLPLVILVGWTTAILRWAFGLLRERRLPRGGWFTWLAVGLVVWTGLGVLVITSLDFKHFLLLLGIQFVASGAVVAAVDSVRTLEQREQVARGLLAFVVLLSAAVILQWVGIDIEALQNGETRKRVETAYGVDAFPNNIGMIKYARSINAGSIELRQDLERLRARTEGMPRFDVFRPKFQAFENQLVVRFHGSARPYEDELESVGVTLQFDNVGLGAGQHRAAHAVVPSQRTHLRRDLRGPLAVRILLPLVGRSPKTPFRVDRGSRPACSGPPSRSPEARGSPSRSASSICSWTRGSLCGTRGEWWRHTSRRLWS